MLKISCSFGQFSTELQTHILKFWNKDGHSKFGESKLDSIEYYFNSGTSNNIEWTKYSNVRYHYLDNRLDSDTTYENGIITSVSKYNYINDVISNKLISRPTSPLIPINPIEFTFDNNGYLIEESVDYFNGLTGYYEIENSVRYDSVHRIDTIFSKSESATSTVYRTNHDTILYFYNSLNQIEREIQNRSFDDNFAYEPSLSQDTIEYYYENEFETERIIHRFGKPYKRITHNYNNDHSLKTTKEYDYKNQSWKLNSTTTQRQNEQGQILERNKTLTSGNNSNKRIYYYSPKTTTSNSIIQNNKFNISLYPNPAYDFLLFKITGELSQPAYFELYDLGGNSILSKRIITQDPI